jgi:hypothetical protein
MSNATWIKRFIGKTGYIYVIVATTSISDLEDAMTPKGKRKFYERADIYG